MSANKDLKPIKRQFPAIIFSPGARDNLSEYTYSLINLASTGFIIVAINDTYLTDVKFPNSQVIPENQDITTNTLYRIKLLDIKFVYHQVLLQHKKHSDVFKYINPSKIGGLGHSAGASAIIAMARQNPGTLKSAVALDAPNTTAWKNSPNLPKTFNVFGRFDIPFIQIHSSYAKDYLGAPKQQFNLSKNNFLVTIAPDKNNTQYFRHMDYSDYTLFKDLPCMQRINNHYGKIKHDNPIFPQLDFGNIRGNTAIAIVNQYITEFFKMYLNGYKNNQFIKCTRLLRNTSLLFGH